MKQALKVVMSYVTVVMIALVIAFDYQVFVFPNRFAPAGLNGLFTMLQHAFGFKLSYATIILNVPLAIASYFINSKPRALRSLTYSISFSAFLMLFEKIDLSALAYSTTSSTLVGPLVAGLIAGFCGYIMHKMNACYGGTEFIAGFIHKYHPNINFFNVIFVLNISVAFISYFVYGYNIEPVLMCVLYCYASSTVRDYINRKHQSAVRCEIITKHPEEIAKDILSQLHHGVTELSGKGVYTGEEKTILLCIVNPGQITELTHLVSKYPDTFVVVSTATRILGNFKRLDSHGNPEVSFFDSGTTVPNK